MLELELGSRVELLEFSSSPADTRQASRFSLNTSPQVKQIHDLVQIASVECFGDAATVVIEAVLVRKRQ
jgi:hypothetical protein